MGFYFVFDIENQQTIICRDRFGEKNLYYFKETDKMHFSSEIAPLVKNINLKKINEDYLIKYLFCSYRYLYSNNQTLYKNIQFVESGTYLIINKNLVIKKKNYFLKENQVQEKKIIKKKLLQILKKF